MKDKLRTPLLDYYQSLKQTNMKSKKMYRIELTRSHTLAQEIAIMACLSNGSGKYISLTDMESVVKVEVIRYPATNDYITVTRTGDTLTIDAKDINILTITEVEIMELSDVPTLSAYEAKEILSGIADENEKNLLN